LGERFREGGGFERAAAYSRAARRGGLIAVSGTAALGPDGQALFAGDAFGQTREAIRRAVAAVERLGGRREDVLRTRLYLVPDCDWEGAVRAHREAFEGVDPANTTLYVAGFIPPGVLVEVELDAAVDEPR
jgi:enamine deaminase RidA (YjgF/YER057c/UK114 family)